MVKVFFGDTSGVTKRYVAEVGSTWVLSWIEPIHNNVIVISELAFVEINSMFNRRLREGSLSAVNVAKLKTDFANHYKTEYLVVFLETGVIDRAADLVDRYNLRTLDAIQLASAHHAAAILNEPMTFISADQNLLVAASAEGFLIDDPNQHP